MLHTPAYEDHTLASPRIDGDCAGLPKGLSSLPDIFSLSDLCDFSSLSRNSATVAASRWVRAGHIALAGPKAGVYIKTSSRSDLLEVIRHVYPSAVVCGQSILHASKWTNSAPNTVHVAVESRPSLVTLHGVTLHKRSPDWFQIVSFPYRGFRSLDPGPHGIRRLRPEWAYADISFHEPENELFHSCAPTDFVTQHLISVARQKLQTCQK